MEDAPQTPVPPIRDPQKCFVHLPSLVAEQFGISYDAARREILMGKVWVDGERRVDPVDLPEADIVDKQIVIAGETRTFTFNFDKE